MNPASIAKRALPMARRIWGLVPASLRAPLLAAAAVGGVGVLHQRVAFTVVDVGGGGHGLSFR